MNRLEIPNPGAAPEFRVKMRSYQAPVFLDRQAGILILHWSRQIGKSHALAHWAVFRLIRQLEKYPAWLLTVLSNSRDNGAEFCLKAAEACRITDASFETFDTSPNLVYENMRMEIRIKRIINGQEHVGRIKVLAANPRTARGFSGDLILDEFAFHENSNAIWEAAEPILASNPEFLCRIASTGNGRHNLFYRMASGPGPDDGAFFESSAGYQVSRVTRTEAWKMGVKVYDAHTRKAIEPGQARAKALDKRAYDQNYECLFNHENMCLLTHELIQSAERPQLSIPIDDQSWSQRSLERLRSATGPLFLGGDVGRTRDLSVFAIIERDGPTRRVIALLRMSGLRLPAQQRQLDLAVGQSKFMKACIDMTGIGLGLVEYAQERWGVYKVQGVNFAATEPLSDRIRSEGRSTETARVTEIMATDLLAVFEDKSISIEVELDSDARDDLRKPEKITSPGGRVSIAAVRDGAGHADHFWAFALAVRAAQHVAAPLRIMPPIGHRAQVLADRRIRECIG